MFRPLILVSLCKKVLHVSRVQQRCRSVNVWSTGKCDLVVVRLWANNRTGVLFATAPSVRVTKNACFVTGQICMITGGHNLGRVGIIMHRERHPGSFDIVHVKDSQGHTFATRLSNVFVIGQVWSCAGRYAAMFEANCDVRKVERDQPVTATRYFLVSRGEPTSWAELWKFEKTEYKCCTCGSMFFLRKIWKVINNSWLAKTR